MNSYYNCLIKSKIIYVFFFNFLFFNYLCQINDNYFSDDLDEADYFLDVKDYHNLNLIITSSKKIFTGIPPIYKSSTEANINYYSSVATYNDNLIVVACLEDSLLAKININNGYHEILLNYFDSLVKPKFICSLIINIDKIYIAISQPSPNSEGKLIHKIIKVDIKNNNNLEIENSSIDNITIQKEYQQTKFSHQILCESLTEKENNGNKLICIYEDLYGNLNFPCVIISSIIKEDFSIEKTLYLYADIQELSMKLFKLNQYYLRIALNIIIFDIYIIYKNSEIKIEISGQANEYFLKNAEFELFDYNKNYNIKIIKDNISQGTALIELPVFEIYYNNSNDYYRIYDTTWTKITKVYTNYDDVNDYYLCVFQVPGKIRYFSFYNNIKIFDIKQYEKVLKIKSNTTQEYNLSQIIESEQNFGLLDEYSCKEINSFNENSIMFYPLLETNFDKVSQILTIDSTNNTWKIYEFCFRDNQISTSREFILVKAKLQVQICSFECSSCVDDYYTCNDCRKKYAKINSDTTGNICYPINQLMEGYIYDSDSNKFEPCFHSCKFCSKKGALSSQNEHNCEFCSEGYYPSYQYLGNCYKINEGDITLDKYVNNINDESFTLNSCLNLGKLFKINSTGECLEECPQESLYYNYKYYDSFNFTDQDYFVIIQQYNRTKEKILKYKFNNFCYEECPLNSYPNNNNECICSFYYYNNTSDNKLICFDEIENCESRNYLYSSPDTLECFETLEECFRKNYSLYFNNNCFKGKCPDGRIILDNIFNDTIKSDISSILNINKNLENKICVCNNLLSYNYLKQNIYNGTQTCVIDPLVVYEEKCINEVYPNEDNIDSNNCPIIYQDSCLKITPKDTCISQRNSHLICLVEVKLNMKIFNFICFEDFLEIEKNIVNISNANTPIFTSPEISIYIYYNQSSVDEVVTNLSVLYLNDCENKLKEKYNLASDEKLYILGIDSPNIFKKSPINVYNYEIFLKNGTQIEDLSMCENTSLTLSSAIINDKLIHYEEALYFSSYGYDIYNINDKFYTSYCSPAAINNNDITLSDRFRDFYPSNISLCNNTCIYSHVNLTSKRIYCSCNPYNYQKYENEKNQESYSNYLLSLINYKIIVCYNLLFDIQNYYNNGGFIIGVLVFIFCFFEFLIFMKFGINLINKQIFDNMTNDIKNKKDEFNQGEDIKKNKNNKNQNNKLFKKKKKHKKVLISDKNNLNNSDLKANSLIIKMNKNIIDVEETDPEVNLFENNLKRKTNNVKVYKKKKKRKKILKKKKIDSSILKLDNFQLYKSILNVSSLSQNNGDFNYNTKIKMFKMDPLFHYNNYITIDDNSVDKKELNNIPYTQALRIDKRQFWEIYLSILFNEVNAINIFYYKNEYVHLSLTTSIYIFSEFLDFTINCFIYSDDKVSEKYHNNGSLTMLSSLTLSFISNIFANIIVFIIAKLTNFSDILDILVKDIRDQKKYHRDIILRITKYIRIKLFIFYFFQFIFLICMIYYLFLFCAVYSNSQISFALNYFYGILESFAISLALALNTTILRYISLKFKISILYNISKYCYQNF